MKITITLDTDAFDSQIQQEGEADTAKDARLLSALASQVFPAVMQQIEALHVRLQQAEAAKEQMKQASLAKKEESEDS